MLYKVRVWASLGPPVLPSLLASFLLPFLAAGLLAGAAATLLAPTPARAESAALKNKSAAAAEKLMQQGAAAITAKNFAAAQSSLTEAYRAYQSPKILYYLGALHAAEQKTIEAQDLLRRFLADSTVEPNEPLRQEAQKLLAGLPPPAAGEVQISAPRGAEVWVDGKVVGALPLPLPLLLSSGAHQVAVQQGKWRAVSQTKVKTARLLELRFKAGSDVVVATELPAVLVADSYPEPALQAPLRQRLLEVVRRQNLAPLLSGEALGYARELDKSGCLADADCQRRLAEKLGVDYILSVKAARSPANPKGLSLELSLFDVAVGAEAAQKSGDCDGCTPDAAAGKLATAAGALLTAVTERGRGDLEISSEPPDAEVFLDGKPVGRTPLKKPVFVGSYGLEVKKSGLRAEPQRITVGPSEPVRLTITLVSDTPVVAAPPPAPLAESPRQRPRWRLGVGGAALGVGALFIGLGASALAVDQHCVHPVENTDGLPPTNCTTQEVFMTQAPGLGLTISGAALLIGGTVLLALPPSIGGERATRSVARAPALRAPAPEGGHATALSTRAP